MSLESWKASLSSEADSLLPKPLKIVVFGAPRTFKTSPVLVRGIGDAWLKDFLLEFQRDIHEPVSEHRIWEWLQNRDTQMPRPRLLPSPAFTAWHRAATMATLPKLEKVRQYLPIAGPVHILARVYREADRGDWCGYMQGIGDWLEDLSIISDDVQLRSFDGSRLLKDPENPRIEVWLSHHSTERDGPMFERSAQEWAGNEEPEPVDCVEAEGPSLRETIDNLRALAPADMEDPIRYMEELSREPDPPEAAGSRLTLFTRYGGTR